MRFIPKAQTCLYRSSATLSSHFIVTAPKHMQGNKRAGPTKGGRGGRSRARGGNRGGRGRTSSSVIDLTPQPTNATGPGQGPVAQQQQQPHDGRSIASYAGAAATHCGAPSRQSVGMRTSVMVIS